MRGKGLGCGTVAGNRRDGKIYPERGPRTETSVDHGARTRFFRGLSIAVLGVVALGASGCAAASRDASPSAASFAADEAAVRDLLARQAAAWNRADLDGFMDGYWRSDDLVFASKDGVTRGHAATLARYRKNYDAPEKFGRLAFTDLSVSAIDAETALVTGAWRLVRAKDEPHGRFVLVVRKFPEGWRVVSDYTTSAS